MTNWNDIGNEEGRLTLHEDGQITWQPNKTNPLPGECVAHIAKGETALSPRITLGEGHGLDEEAQNRIHGVIDQWLDAHIKEVLAPLFLLKDEAENKIEGAALEIGEKLFDAMGVIHRSEIEVHVPALTPELRTPLRRKRVKMGPILVFMPDLVKPAAINLRALLWGVWYDKALPMERPADGRVSVRLDPQAVDRNYYRSIGYPVFGAMAIRIDMLDRVVTDIYDSSKDWQFAAQHKYMEWLGCGEEDLYAILESMGFRRVKKDVVAPQETEASDNKAGEEVTKAEETPDTPDTPEKVESEAAASQTTEAEAVKPTLVRFWLKKGKISDRPQPKARHKAAKKEATKPAKKPMKKISKKPQGAKTYSAPVKAHEVDDDSPFSILKQLQK